jgi:Pyruvate/2-oxoacid:ferredoxin oxidoreductase delta subunit
VPCINAIGLHQLAAWYRAGLRSLVLNIAQCKGCRWADERGLVYRLVRWNRLLEKRGLGRLAVIVQQPRPTDEIAPGHDKGDTRLDRRGFLQRLLTAAEPAPANDELGLAPVTAAQPTAKRGDYILYAPVIDLDRCSGCDACIRICRHHALNPGDNGDTYQIAADRCSGCGLCVDVCDREAIVIIRDRVLPRAEVVLYPQVCRACGAKFHPPRPATTNMPLCHVCSASNHYDRLFQVL